MVCHDSHVVSLLMSLFASNNTEHNYKSSIFDCENETDTFEQVEEQLNTSISNFHVAFNELPKWEVGEDVYAYACPFIILIGLMGNLISLRVFTSRQLRKLSASYYLIALSASDSIVLLSYVLMDWLYRGLPIWPGGPIIYLIHINGVCQLFLFLSYTFRFISVYLIVVFTIERYIAVCRPLHRRRICTKSFAKRAILGVHIIGCLLCCYKPLLSGVYEITKPLLPFEGIDGDIFGSYNLSESDNREEGFSNAPNDKICSRNTDFDRVNLVMDFSYGLCITAIPFVIVTIYNLLILKKLMVGKPVKTTAVVPRNHLRLELTFTLLAISAAFIILNLPYFVIWVQQYIQSMNPGDPTNAHDNRNKLYITKTIFIINYAINFFLYCMTGTYYRGVIKRMLTCQKHLQGVLVSRPSTSSAKTEFREMTSFRERTYSFA